MKKGVGKVIVAVVMSLVVLAGCSKLDPAEIAITVDDMTISAGLANFYSRYTQAIYETYYAGYFGEDMWGQEVSEGVNYEENVKESVQENLENMLLLEKHMDEYDVSLSDEEKAAIDESTTEFTDANSQSDIEKVSGTKDVVNRLFTLIAIQSKMTEAIQAGADTNVTDEEAAQKKLTYVDFVFESEESDEADAADDETSDDTDSSVTANAEDEFTDEEKAATKAKVDAFLEGAKAAEDFTAYCEEQGVTATEVTFDSDSYSPSTDVIAAADVLKEGEFADPIEYSGGYYVVKLLSEFDQEATDTEKTSIVNERKSTLYTETIDAWREEAEITVNADVWKKINFKKLTVTIKQAESEPYEDDAQTDDVAE
ncbi:MAG: peptidyl-prolyl cis-trans isomerase [Lachnospiraceae bacterium]|jgi:parvulin-like peptidyl-prolyl isomerase|nr:peptidyl-prolyl cis-trans isomerase [Lachnospiraceae bacterium]